MSGSQFRSPMATEQASTIANLLQSLLVDLLDLGLMLKQAHWNVRGALFMPLHEQLDTIVDTTREAADEIAERIATLGFPANGLSATIASQSRINTIHAGFLATPDVVEAMSGRLEAMIQFLRTAIDEVGSLDPITQDMLIGITASFEKHLWMLQSQHL